MKSQPLFYIGALSLYINLCPSRKLTPDIRFFAQGWIEVGGGFSSQR